LCQQERFSFFVFRLSLGVGESYVIWYLQIEKRETKNEKRVRPNFTLSLANGRTIPLGPRTIVVGVLNVTPDSFSDGGQNFDPVQAIERAVAMQAEGADIIEVGGESTRPGATALSIEDEIARVGPVLKALAARLTVPVAIDTYKSEVARAAVESGAAIINDVSALRFDAAIADVAAQTGAALVLMHMRGDPATMQKLPPSPDIFAELDRDLKTAIERAVSRGVRREQIVIDPGIGFGKTLEDNLAIINHLDRCCRFGLPLMIGTSRKSFIGRLTGQPASERLPGTAASVAIAISRGAHMIRVHDVKEMVEVARVSDAIAGSSLP
jgi:dihydropteroate synthase